jgi:hypothetical protein
MRDRHYPTGRIVTNFMDGVLQIVIPAGSLSDMFTKYRHHDVE